MIPGFIPSFPVGTLQYSYLSVMQKVAFWILFLSALKCVGQQPITDTLYQLNPVTIESSRLSRFSAGMRSEVVDSSLVRMNGNLSLSSLISEYTPALVRSYGTGGLATLSFRGTQTTQSGVFWNGFNLNQPNMGMTDLSEVPSFFFDQINIQYGGGSAMYGSGVIGGSLHLANTSPFSAPLCSTISLSAGSFNDYTVAAKVNAGNSRLAFSSAIFGNTDRNNFKYQNLYNSYEHLDHAKSLSEGIIQQFAFRIRPNQTVTAAAWWQKSDKQLPATLVMASSDQKQVDEAFRSTIQWERLSVISLVQFRAAFFAEQLHYSSPSALIDAIYKLKTISTSAEYKRQLGKNTAIETGVSYKRLMADVPYYDGKRTQDESALFASIAHEWGSSGLKSVLNLRQDLNDGYPVPFCPSFGTEGRITKNLHFRFSISRNFRVPTLNDRFWQPGGNPDLLPESSWNQEGGLNWTIPVENEKLKVEFGTTFYNMFINNLILWESVSSNVWSPKNVQQVWSRGIESYGKINLLSGITSGYLRLSYNYSPSTYRLSTVSGDISKGKQLIYIPLHKFNASIQLNHGPWYSMVNLSMNGKRFVAKDNQQSLPAFILLNATAGREIRFKPFSGRIQLGIRNLSNSQYQVVEYYPEPGVSVMFSLIISIQKIKKS